MATNPPATGSVRNIALVGHTGTGKTSLLEAMLLHAGTINRLGRVDDGTAVGDADPDERARHQSLALHAVSFGWQGHTVNVIDTPGHPDFRADALHALAAAELAVFVIDGVSGVQSQDLALWRAAERLRRPRMLFVNKLDRAHSSFDRTLAQLRARFGAQADPVELPIGEESTFHGVADLLTDEAFLYDHGPQPDRAAVPAELVDAEREGHEHLVDDVVEGDEAVLERYLDGVEPTPAELEHLLHDALDDGRMFPVLCGSATGLIAVDHLLDLVCRVGPAPGDLGPLVVEGPGGEVEVACDPDGPPLAVVFKTRLDEFVGQISLLKVLSGTIRIDHELVNTRTLKVERLHHLGPLAAAGRGGAGAKGAAGTDSGSGARLGSATAGDIVAVAKLADTRTGDTLAPVGTPITVPPPAVPPPVHGVAIRPRQPSHEDKLATTLRRLQIEDPALAVAHDAATRQTILTGTGETHLAVAIARIERLGVPLDVEATRVAYRETLAAPVQVEGRYKKQTGGHGQFGVAVVRFEPLPLGTGYEFHSEVTGGAIPRGLIPAVGAGIAEAMDRGGRFGFPVVDVRAVCVDGKTHAVDSSEMSFKMAGALALRQALDEVGAVVLEPVSELAVQVPPQHQGDVLGDLSARRGQVLGTELDGADGVSIHALVPTAEIQQYAVELRSMTGGAGTFELAHHGYQPLPDALVAQVTAS